MRAARAVAMRNAGVEQIPVLLFDSSNKYSKSEIGELTLTGQDFGGTWSDAEVRVHNLLPLSYENRDAVVERFTMPTDERSCNIPSQRRKRRRRRCRRRRTKRRRTASVHRCRRRHRTT